MTGETPAAVVAGSGRAGAVISGGKDGGQWRDLTVACETGGCEREDRMAEAAASFPVVREAVASFPDRAHFHRAVSNLLAAGFATSDLSVLASHDSLTTAGEPAAGSDAGRRGVLPAGLSDEIKYIGPLTVAGIVVLSGGPIAVAVAALVGAGLGGAALKELFDDYTAPRHRDDFNAALQAGAALLWVRCDGPDRELAATRILEEAGGRHVHIHGRPSEPGSNS
jgi:hypothetical protein